MKLTSIPVGIPLSETFRLLCYLKTEYKAGYFHKCDLDKVCRRYGKDARTISKLIGELLKQGLIGENCRTYFLRNYKFITRKLAIGTRAFKCSIDEIRERSIFEAKQFSARVEFLVRYYRRKKRGAKSAKETGCINQINIPLPSGLLSKTLSVSTGKITKIKRIAVNEGFLKVVKTFTPIGGPGSGHMANMLQAEIPGVFSKDGILVRRAADTMESFVSTFRIKSRRAW